MEAIFRVLNVNNVGSFRYFKTTITTRTYCYIIRIKRLIIEVTDSIGSTHLILVTYIYVILLFNMLCTWKGIYLPNHCAADNPKLTQTCNNSRNTLSIAILRQFKTLSQRWFRFYTDRCGLYGHYIWQDSLSFQILSLLLPM